MCLYRARPPPLRWWGRWASGRVEARRWGGRRATVLWRHRGAGSGEDMRDLVMPVFLCVATCTASSSSWLPRLPQVGNQGLQFFSFVCLILRWIHRVCKLAYPLCTFFLWQGSWCKGLICCLGFDLYKKKPGTLARCRCCFVVQYKKRWFIASAAICCW
jgi:hypothetical protein